MRVEQIFSSKFLYELTLLETIIFCVILFFTLMKFTKIQGFQISCCCPNLLSLLILSQSPIKIHKNGKAYTSSCPLPKHKLMMMMSNSVYVYPFPDKPKQKRICCLMLYLFKKGTSQSLDDHLNNNATSCSMHKRNHTA